MITHKLFGYYGASAQINGHIINYLKYTNISMFNLFHLLAVLHEAVLFQAFCYRPIHCMYQIILIYEIMKHETLKIYLAHFSYSPK